MRFAPAVCAAVIAGLLLVIALAVQPAGSTKHGAALSAAVQPRSAGHPRSAAARPAAAHTWLGYPDVRARQAAVVRVTAGRVSNITATGSLNWAGYAVNRAGVTFTAIRATFFVPYLDCSKSPGQTMASYWAGFDGFDAHSESVEQVGIAADCSSAGKPSYFGWYEMFPEPQARAPITIHPGDSVTVAVFFSAERGDFHLTLTDNTAGGQFSRFRRCPRRKVGGKQLRCLRHSAEVIAEAPASGAGRHVVIDRLSDYGALSFAGIRVADAKGVHGGIVSADWDTTKITELSPGSSASVALPTPVQADMFDDYWLRQD